jgi:hypothetical protein
MQGKEYVNFLLEERDKIEEFIAEISGEMLEYMGAKKDSKFVLFYKYLTHSDLATFGKATKVNSLEKNLLYYINTNEMSEIEKKTNKPFQTAHQSCIGLKEKFYELAKLPKPRDVDPYLINDHMNVYLVNSNMKYFTGEYTKKIFEKLGKQISKNSKRNWEFDDLNIALSEEQFTEIPLHCAVHGLGMATDEEFHKLRHHLFKGDTFILLAELTSTGENNLFILLEKNPIFFSILGETNKSYENYQVGLRKRLVSKVISKENAVENLEEEVTRQQQNAWRKMLAKEMMGYTQVEDQIFCPFTYITVKFNELGTLFVASHIKGFKDPNTTNEEKYDVNNGILICANADALFDKHLISINENKELIFSFLLDADVRLKTQLLLMQPIFQPILNEKRMEYLKYHREVFYEMEKLRKTI